MPRPPDDADLPRHPIAVVAERTGLSQDVLRVWERRYAAVLPRRDAGGQRLYADADLARLALLQAATRGGRSIGQVARLDATALAALVEDDAAAREHAERRDAVAAPTTGAARVMDAALAHARALDAARLDETLRRAAARMGVSAFLELVAAPLLRRVGDEWHAGRMTPSQEHLVSSVVHAIAAETLRAFAAPGGAPRLLVTTPAGDRHAIGAALVGAAAAMEGWNVLYLGADLPAADIAAAAVASGARMVGLSMVYVDSAERMLDELRMLRARLPADVVVLAGGTGAGALATPLRAMGIRVESSLPGLVAELRREQAAA
jgi:DNA-binding transcriptional MerR regulator/methylmalonyl-CoA mutase cobalamin-binding subunit